MKGKRCIEGCGREQTPRTSYCRKCYRRINQQLNRGKVVSLDALPEYELERQLFLMWERDSL